MRRRAELVVLAGFLRLLTDGFVAGWRDRLVNIHPALLPSFRGVDTHRPRLEARRASCTAAPCISCGLKRIPARSSPRPWCRCWPDDTPDTLGASRARRPSTSSSAGAAPHRRGPGHGSRMNAPSSMAAPSQHSLQPGALAMRRWLLALALLLPLGSGARADVTVIISRC